MRTNDTIWLISEISAIIGEGIGSICDDLYVWYKDDCEIILNVTKQEIEFVNCLNLDFKTHYAICGLSSQRGIKLLE